MENKERSLVVGEYKDVDADSIEDISNMVRAELFKHNINLGSTEHEDKYEHHTCQATANDTILNANESVDCGKTFLKEPCDVLNNLAKNFAIDEKRNPTDACADSFATCFKTESSTASLLAEADTCDITDQCEGKKMSHVELFGTNLDQKCHNLPVCQLRKKLSFCPVCKTQYGNHKMANLCLAKHGKRQCWLCLDVLSSKKEDFYRHCIEFHSISKVGDIVGCPYCGKCFDFRQGLNQHIVKIHFAENISDIESVASLSPTTLVDIFTGKPRTSSSSSDDIPPLQTCETDGTQVTDTMDFPVRGNMKLHPQDTPPLKSTANANGSSSISVSAISTPAHSHPQFTTSGPCRIITLIGKPYSTTEIPSLARPSVIASSCNNTHNQSVQKMNVPPETSLSSLLRKNETQFQRCSGDDNILYQTGNDIEVEENTSFEWQNPENTNLNNFYTRSAQRQDSQLHTCTVSTPEKYETMQGTSFSLEQHPSTYTSYLTREEAGYEKNFTRSDHYLGSNASSQQQHQDFVCDPDRSHSAVSRNSSNVMADALTIKGCMTNIDLGAEAISYAKSNSMINSSMRRILEVVTKLDTRTAETPGTEVSAKSTLTLESSMMGPTVPSTNLYPRSDTRFSEVGQFAVPKLPDNCGMKRRILTKAMWDEQQTKKPMHSPEIVRDVHAAASRFPTSITSRRPPATQGFNRGYSYSVDPTLQSGNGLQNQLQSPHLEFCPSSCSIPKKDAGPFFEQYIKQDRHRQGVSLKLLDLAHASTRRAAGDDTKDQNIDFGSQNSSVLTLLTGTSPISSTFSTASQPSSCSRHGFSRPPLPKPNDSHIPSIYSTNMRGRRPPNPAFWDTLRARLISSQSTNYGSIGIGTSVASKASAHSPSSVFTRPSGEPRRPMESVVVQNPFEEESVCNEHGITGFNEFCNRYEIACSSFSNANENRSTQLNPQKTTFSSGLLNIPLYVDRTDTTLRFHPYAKISESSTSVQHSGNGNGSETSCFNMTDKSTLQKSTIGKTEMSSTVIKADLSRQFALSVRANQQTTAPSQPIFFPSRYSDEYHNKQNRLNALDKFRKSYK